MFDILYNLAGGIITGGAVVAFIFAFYKDVKRGKRRNKPTLFARINKGSGSSS